MAIGAESPIVGLPRDLSAAIVRINELAQKVSEAQKAADAAKQTQSQLEQDYLAKQAIADAARLVWASSDAVVLQNKVGEAQQALRAAFMELGLTLQPR